MNSTHLTGLGKPDASGKQALFQPPMSEPGESNSVPEEPTATHTMKKSPKEKQRVTRRIHRVRITTELTVEALQAIQAIQQDYRLNHGRVLPQWKVFSQAIVTYAKARGIRKQT